MSILRKIIRNIPFQQVLHLLTSLHIHSTTNSTSTNSHLSSVCNISPPSIIIIMSPSVVVTKWADSTRLLLPTTTRLISLNIVGIMKLAANCDSSTVKSQPTSLYFISTGDTSKSLTPFLELATSLQMQATAAAKVLNSLSLPILSTTGTLA